MSLEEQFDVAAQDRRAEAAKAARLSGLAKELEQVADQIEWLACSACEVPEEPAVEQEPEITQPQVAPDDPDAPKPEGP